MEAELAGAAAQFGVAGLVAWMWLAERRAAADRERRLMEAHERLRQDRPRLAVLVEALRANTRAMTALEAQQRRLACAIERLAGGSDERSTRQAS